MLLMYVLANSNKMYVTNIQFSASPTGGYGYPHGNRTPKIGKHEFLTIVVFYQECSQTSTTCRHTTWPNGLEIKYYGMMGANPE